MKTKLKTSILAGLSALLTLFPTVKGSTLDEISKPYLGVYECKQATLGSKDLLCELERMELELTDGEHYTLHYQTKKGSRKKIEGKYAYDKEREVFTVTDKTGAFKREFPLKDGVIVVTLPMGRKQLVLHFEQK